MNTQPRPTKQTGITSSFRHKIERGFGRKCVKHKSRVRIAHREAEQPFAGLFVSAIEGWFRSPFESIGIENTETAPTFLNEGVAAALKKWCMCPDPVCRDNRRRSGRVVGFEIEEMVRESLD